MLDPDKSNAQLYTHAVNKFEVPVDLTGPDRDVPYDDQKPRSVLALADGQPHWRVLVANEHRAARLLLVRLLAPVGFDVRQAEGGQEVIDTWQAWRPHLILIDLGMLAMDGREATQRIKAGSEGCAPIIIALAAGSFKQSRRALLQAGCDDLLSMPFQDTDLYEMLRKHLGVQYIYAGNPAGMAHSDAESGEVALAEPIAQASDRNREGINGPKGASRRQQKHLEAKNIQLQESEELHRLILSSISDTVFLTDDGGAFKFICPNVNTIFGYSIQEVEALSNISKLLGGDLFVPAELETLGEIQNIEHTITDQAGKAHALLVNVKRVSIREGTRLYTCRDITERKRAEEALHASELRYHELWKHTQAALTKTEALYRVNRSLIATIDLPGLLKAMVENVANFLPANRVVVVTTDLTQRRVIREVRGGPGKNYVVDIDFDELWDGLSGWVLREGKPALSPNSGPDPRESLRAQRRRVETNCGSIIIAPLLYQDKILGTMMAINCPDERDFTQEDLELMVAFASQAAIAIENARLYVKLQSSYDEMEQRVEERTAELAQVNASLKAEIAERKRAEEALQATVLEKERLFQAEARRRHEAETLREVAAVISATTDRSAVLGLILDQLKRVVPYDSASVMLIAGDLLDMVAQRGLQTEKPFPAPIRLENFPHLGQVLEHRQPVMIADTVADARWQASPHTSHIRCWLGVPLVIQDKVIGLLNVDKVQPGFYSERDAGLAMAFADYAGIALENARLFDQIHRRAQDLEALEAISSGLRQAGTREAMMQFIVKKSVEALSCDAGALLQVEGRSLVLKAEYGRSTGLLGRPHPVVTCAHWQAVKTGEPLYVTDEGAGLRPAQQSGSPYQCEICDAMMRDMATGVVIPLKTAEATIGLLHLVFASRREFSDQKRHMLATIAEITGSALHRAGILDTLELRVADRTRELAALYDVTAVSSEALDLQTMLERSLERVLKAMRSSTATIHLLDERGETLSLAAYQTIAPAGPAEIDFSTPAPHVKEWLIVRGEPLIIPDMSSGSQMFWATGVSRACTYAGAPMRARGRRLGMLSVVRDADQQFSVEEVALLASIADQVAITVENARLHQHAEQMAIVEERARLARELHDSVTQCLSSVRLLAQAASDFGEAGEWGRVKHYLERIRDTGGQALKEMRLLLYELQPPSTEQEDLVEMLTRRFEAVEERAGVNVRLLTENWLRLPASTEEALSRITQEALNNALKHSGASMVTIVLRGNPDGADLEVNDNGMGFDPDSVKRKGGIGLLSMQQRAERLGGGLTIRSAPGEGTSIKVNLRTRR
jgi:PAS domain S-box-containing protein